MYADDRRSDDSGARAEGGRAANRSPLDARLVTQLDVE